MIRRVIEIDTDGTISAGTITNLYTAYGRDTDDPTKAASCVVEIAPEKYISIEVNALEIFTVH